MPALHNRLGLILQRCQRLDEAAACFRRAIELRSDYAPAHCNLGNTLVLLKRGDAALEVLDQALRLQTPYPEAWNAKNLALRELGRYDEALAAVEQALQQRPGYAKAILNRGATLALLGRGEAAAAAYRSALDLEPGNVDALLRLSQILHAGCCWPQSCRAAEQAWSLAAAEPRVAAQLLYTRSFICDWRQRAELRRQVVAAAKDQLARGLESSLWPAASLRLLDDPQLQFDIASRYARRLSDETANVRRQGNLPRRWEHGAQPLRIGYVSGGFRDYPFGHLSRRLYALHDRRKFEVLAYSLEPDDGNEYRRAIAADCDRFVDAAGQSPLELARRIAADGVQLLIAHDTLFTNHAVAALAMRPAPIQVSWLYPGPCGAELADYVLTDRVVTPAGQEKFYGEQPFFLPHTHYVMDNTREPAPETPSRRECGLPEQGFVFCCFNLCSKLEPETFDVWMRILSQTPHSVLWLLSDLPEVRDNLRREAQERGVAAERIVFAGRVSRPLHLARHRQADLFLDTLPYNAHTTAVDAMWAGLPLITLPGRTHASRVAASIVTAAGMPELIVADLDEYEQRAVRWARNPQELALVREKMAAQRATCPLLNTEAFVRDLESAYQDMWQRYANQ